MRHEILRSCPQSGREEVQSGGHSAQTDVYNVPPVGLGACLHQSTAIRDIIYEAPVKGLAWCMWVKLQEKTFSLERVLLPKLPT